MLVIRQVTLNDLDDLLALAHKAGKGMTSLPTDPEAMRQKVLDSNESFLRHDPSLHDFFFLALEDTESGRVIGTASVHSRTGSRQAFYAYRVMPVTHFSHSLNREVRAELLHLTNDYTDCSEVGSLFVDPDFRGNGRWLAESRYLLMGQFPDRFAEFVIAELRGIVLEDGTSPVWEAIGRHFFEMEYEEADILCGKGSNQFITELMPKHPLYTCLLPESAREAIGAPNKDSRRAMEFLQNEGYEYENVVDIFDGGPIMRGKISNLRSVRNITEGTAAVGTHFDESTPAVVATTELDQFRVVNCPVERQSDGKVLMPAGALAALNIREGDPVRFIHP